MRQIRSVLACVAVLLIMDILVACAPTIVYYEQNDEDGENYASARTSGIDVRPINVKFNYPNSADQDKYKMFSSNHPIPNFNRPEMLFVIDGMKGVDLQITITIENIGVNPSGTFNTQIEVLHDEYSEFVLLDTQISSASINPGSSADITFTWNPTYSGNHSMLITTLHTTDDNTGNDLRSRHLTIGSIYDNCDDLSLWTVGSSWSSSTEAAISAGRSCHVGNGASSNYGNGLTTSLYTPIFDLSNRHPNPTRAIGLSFFATGAGEANDIVSFQGRRADGQWEQIGIIGGNIDTNLNSWNTNTNTVGSQTLPVMPMNVGQLHATSQFRMQFTSDASGTNIGYWIDDLVWYYDEIALESEFDWSIGANNQSSARRGYWTDQLVTIHNNGNASDRFLPTVTGLPSEWDVSFLHESGGGINSLSGVMVLPGESHNIRVRLKPGENATIGPAQYNLKITSATYSTHFDLKQMSVNVDPDFIPEIQEMTSIPACAPGSTCEFFVEVNNIGDASDSFDLSVRDINIRSGWTLGLSWSQVSPITISAGSSEMVKFVISVPADAEPDLTSSIWFDVNSFTDPSRVDSKIIEAKAAMVSNAEVGLDPSVYAGIDWSVIPGGSTSVTFTLWNNATRQDVFDVGVLVQGGRSWNVSQPSVSSMAVNPSSHATFTVSVSAPTTGQANDPGPIITPYATSTRSNTNATATAFTNLVIAPQYDLVIREVYFPAIIEPGVATAYSVEIENDGNGVVNAEISIPNMPESWDWWTVVDGENQSGSISLTPSYELEDTASIDIMMLLPPDEEPNEELELQILVVPSDGGIDLTPANNQLYITTLTAQVKRPEIRNFNTTQINMRVGETIALDFEVHNVGNVGDPNLRVKAQLQTMPQTSGVELLLINLDNPSISTSESNWIDISQPARGIGHLQLKVIVSDETPINTNIAITIVVEGGDGGNDLPITLNENVVIIADERRDVSLDLYYETSQVMAGSAMQFSFTAWSNSSVLETLELIPQFPQGWSLECDGLQIDAGIEITLIKSDGMRPTSSVVECTLLNGGDINDGELTWIISNQEGEELMSGEDYFTFTTSNDDAKGALDFINMDTKTLAIVVVVLVISVVFTLLILAKKRRAIVEDDYDEVEDENTQPVQPVQPAYQPIAHPVQPAYQPVAQPVQPIQPAHQTPATLPATQAPQWTDEQLAASGWTAEQIQYHRMQSTTASAPEQESKSLNDAFSAL
ncbi:MAG: hypothetical protein HOE92_03795 [Euryarchaeota archaeon]|nr:hypothetical protein [Euryarchaeota archaeon]MBT3971324.1 hypothetical protein [Euryarchaeota archaeon]